MGHNVEAGDLVASMLELVEMMGRDRSEELFNIFKALSNVYVDSGFDMDRATNFLKTV
jgi:hypothetical protein